MSSPGNAAHMHASVRCQGEHRLCQLHGVAAWAHRHHSHHPGPCQQTRAGRTTAAPQLWLKLRGRLAHCPAAPAGRPLPPAATVLPAMSRQAPSTEDALRPGGERWREGLIRSRTPAQLQRTVEMSSPVSCGIEWIAGASDWKDLTSGSGLFLMSMQAAEHHVQFNSCPIQ